MNVVAGHDQQTEEQQIIYHYIRPLSINYSTFPISISAAKIRK